MSVKNLQQCLRDLEASGKLIRIESPVDAHLEAAEIHRRVFTNKGPALFFTNVTGCQFPMVSNLFGTLERSEYIFRDTIKQVKRLVAAKVDPMHILKHPLRNMGMPFHAWNMLPKRRRSGPIMEATCQVSDLPQLQSWPDDGGSFITLPQVYTEHPDRPGMLQANLGMYRVQLSGGQYVPNREVGLHYQIHRGIGVHQQAAMAKGDPLKVNIFVGGSPAMSLAAVMPLPEGMSELTFAGALCGSRINMVHQPGQLPIYAEADFCIEGQVLPDENRPEGPFGDHLGYYSLIHEFPVMKVTRVRHRKNAIWPFTVVGRPPQEDTRFGELIHEITGPVIPTVLPGVKAIHAVDAAGVHPLLFAIGSERYTPYSNENRPQELLTQANAILGQGQLSLAKYLFIVNRFDNESLDIEDSSKFLQHILCRVDWRRDLHFQTETTIDTLDYSGHELNQGSKVVVAASGPKRRALPTELPAGVNLPAGFSNPQILMPGVLIVQGPKADVVECGAQLSQFCQAFNGQDSINEFPLIVLADDSAFTAANISNFQWVTFTRSNPAVDVDGIASGIKHKHWGCEGSLVIDARIKPHHAPPLIEDPEVTKKVDALAGQRLPVSKYL
ncbi:MAG: 3-octaprenyl-4-hydroxybenzoate carboxy-lyase [Planctomycetaceae bacterium]|nr:3-octaprenyl-4-hydroxybenzoate carboxy-lyase [Planctomycetaceae bacterium]